MAVNVAAIVVFKRYERPKASRWVTWLSAGLCVGSPTTSPYATRRKPIHGGLTKTSCFQQLPMPIWLALMESNKPKQR